ncbi:MAG TPA: c-type cytochrome domain-containing protein [Kofleriaceae bacterium]|nr:c-type cytochrome domain-containing protein [Kofleriaceae bacterium]
MRPFVWLFAAFSVAALAGCPGPDDPGTPECVTVDPSCAPLYQPVYDEIFTRTLAPTCGVAGNSCHSSEGRKNGLAFADPDEAFDLLLGSDGHPRVSPGDPECSLIVERLASSDPDFQMPPGAPLSAAEQCVIQQWIADGAKR